MTSHLSPETLSALADGELQTQELAAAQEHLAGCATCTSNALAQTLLKSATARAGQRYAAAAGVERAPFTADRAGSGQGAGSAAARSDAAS